MTAAQASAAGSAQAAQEGLAAVVALDVGRALSTVDLSALRTSLPDLAALVAALVHRYGSASATLAARQYAAARSAAGVFTPFQVRPAGLPPLEQVGATVDWATQPLWSAEPDVDLARRKLEGAASRLVLDVGRQTVTENVLRDRQAKGWARVPEPGACSFCAMLATRGAVYKHETAGFRSHDHCRCHAEPVFTAYEPSAQIREWQALWRESTRGLSGTNARNAFRRAFAG